MKILPEYITINEDVIGGKPVIAGTRIPVPLIIEEMAGGTPIERIMEEYDLTREQVLAALRYVAEIVGEETVFTTSYETSGNR